MKHQRLVIENGNPINAQVGQMYVHPVALRLVKEFPPQIFIDSVDSRDNDPTVSLVNVTVHYSDRKYFVQVPVVTSELNYVVHGSAAQFALHMIQVINEEIGT